MDGHNRERNRRIRQIVYLPICIEIKSLTATVETVSFDGTNIESDDRTFERTTIRVRGEDVTKGWEDATRPIYEHERSHEEGLPIAASDLTQNVLRRSRC